MLAIQRAVDDNQADILNVSFGECEQQLGASGNQFFLNLWEQAAAQGISVTVSSGDSGSAGCDDQDTETAATRKDWRVNGLGSTPYNISVGGTDFDVLYSNFPNSFTQYVDTTNALPNHRSALGYIPEEPLERFHLSKYRYLRQQAAFGNLGQCKRQQYNRWRRRHQFALPSAVLAGWFCPWQWP